MPEGNDEREQRILDAAAELIAHYGYDKTTVDEIARDAHVSKGAIYLHFKSKEQLFEALLLREAEALNARYFELIGADPKGVTLFNIYRYALQIVDESPLMKAIYTQDRRVLGDYLRHVRDSPAYKQAASFTVEAVRQFQSAGLMRSDLDAEAVSYLLTAMSYGVLTMDSYLTSGQAPSMTRLGETLAEMLASGIVPHDREGAPDEVGDQEAARQTLQQISDVKTQFLEERRNQRR
ncbi:MAG: helix-turn-helix domain-containing protein [Chloroflexota bacterium]